MIEVEENAHARSPSAEPLDNLPADVQDRIGIICGDVRGVLLIEKARVLYQGEDISPTEFEKLGGRSASKKWKTSLRVVNPDGTAGQLIGDWLQSHGIDIKHSQLVRFTGKGSPPLSRPQRPELRPPAAKPPPVAKAPQAVKPPRPAAAVKPQPVQTSTVDLLVHLQSQYIGFIPGDPTVENVPDELPAFSVGSDVTVIDLERMSYEDLMKLSRESAPDPLGALLPAQPGILPEREARLTGHQPAKRPRMTRAVDANEAAALVGDYMAGRLADPPWGAFGLTREPVICGYELDLHQLYNAVQNFGGYDATISKKSWGKVATKLGIDKSSHTNASFVLRNTYSKFLLAYETQARALSVRNSLEEHTPTQEEPILQHGSEQHQAENVGAPSAAHVDVLVQGCELAAPVVHQLVEPVAAMQDPPQQRADDGKADAPVNLTQQTADVDFFDSMDDSKEKQAPAHAEYVLEAQVEGCNPVILEDEHPTERFREQGISDAAGLEALEGATVMKSATQASESQEVDNMN